MMESIFHWLENILLKNGVDMQWASYINLTVNLLIIAALAKAMHFFSRRVLLGFFIVWARRSRNHFDDYLVRNRVPRLLAHLVPLVIVVPFLPTVLKDFLLLANFVDEAIAIYVVVLTLWIVRGVLRTIKDYLKTLDNFKDKPIDSYIQVFMIFAWTIGILIIFSILSGKSVWSFLGAFGAASAVLLLIFKDTILGFVASIQVSVNDIVRIGDWITMEKYGADGDVIEINLVTVKVRNFDNTITTIPTYYLISDSFKNWRGMVTSGGRRIKRSLFIKVNSVRFVDKNELPEFAKIQFLTEYINHRQKDIEHYNKLQNADKSLLINGRNLTNLGLFRKYIDQYISHHSAINKNMMIMTRHLQPTTQGIPLEIYAFSTDKRWENYEHIMADIFDHLISATRYFDLELYELPTGRDWSAH